MRKREEGRRMKRDGRGCWNVIERERANEAVEGEGSIGL